MPTPSTRFAVKLKRRLKVRGADSQPAVEKAQSRAIQLDGGFWRRRWDSNPRWSCPHAGFQDRYIRPLCHPSGHPQYMRGISKLEGMYRSALLFIIHAGQLIGDSQCLHPVSCKSTAKRMALQFPSALVRPTPCSRCAKTQPVPRGAASERFQRSRMHGLSRVTDGDTMNGCGGEILNDAPKRNTVVAPRQLRPVQEPQGIDQSGAREQSCSCLCFLASPA